MSDDTQQPIVVKKIKKGGGGAHGGAWKIAYADFVTAMMAFFLLMWLLGSTAQGDLQGIAEFFNSPLKVAMSGGSGAGDATSPIAGGGQERGLRSGTENVAAIVGFGVACERAVSRRADEVLRLTALRVEVEQALTALGARIFSAAAPRLPNTVFFAVPDIDGETMVGKLDRAGFACASGSACSSANPEPSHTLLAMGVEPGIARAAVRVSLGRDTVADDVRRFIETFVRVMGELKNLASVAA